MRSPRRRWLTAAGGTLTAAIAATAAFAAPPGGPNTGPNTITDPYVVGVAPGVSTKSLLTVSDGRAADNGYDMIGIPDGLGAADIKGTRDFNLYMNHELRKNQGTVRKHGDPGALVSKFRIDPKTLAVEKGDDLITPTVRYWDYPTQTYRTEVASSGAPNPRDPSDQFLPQTAAFGRFCSSSLTLPGQLYNERTGRGTKQQVYFANEEDGDEGRVFGVLRNGQTQQLPRLGLFQWENTLVAPNRSDTTFTMGQEDLGFTGTGANIPGGQVWGYVGKKQKSGNAFDKAGLTNGKDFVIDLDDESTNTDAEYRAKYGKYNPQPFDLGAAEEVDWDSSGKRQNEEAAAKGFSMNRVEDGAWDPQNRNHFYFLTTEGGVDDTVDLPRDGGGLWVLKYKDIERPNLGGTIELLLDGSEPPFLRKPDNMDIDRRGNLLIQEDPGNDPRQARIIAYDIDDGDLGVVAEFNPATFPLTLPSPLPPPSSSTPGTTDEESSGIIDAEKFLGKGQFLFDAQVHRANPDPEKVEYGQLLTLKVRDFDGVYNVEGDRPDQDDDDDDDERDDD